MTAGPEAEIESNSRRLKLLSSACLPIPVLSHRVCRVVTAANMFVGHLQV